MLARGEAGARPQSLAGGVTPGHGTQAQCRLYAGRYKHGQRDAGQGMVTYPKVRDTDTAQCSGNMAISVSQGLC